jgi:tRNA pseudouridine55 synthase
MYSAVKHQGQRLYRLARQGQTVVRQARDIVIQRLELLDVRGPEVTLAVTCSKGTYIRTLAEDIGLALGYGAHMLHLQRCRVGTVTVSQAYTLPCIQQHCQAGTLAEILVPVAQALAFLPALWLTVEQYKTLQTHQGSALAAILPVSQSTAAAASCYRLCTASDQTVAVIQRQTSAPEKWKVQGLVSP